MNDIPFHQTPMGRTFFGYTMPELVRQLMRLNEQLQNLIEESKKVRQGTQPEHINKMGDWS